MATGQARARSRGGTAASITENLQGNPPVVAIRHTAMLACCNVSQLALAPRRCGYHYSHIPVPIHLIWEMVELIVRQILQQHASMGITISGLSR